MKINRSRNENLQFAKWPSTFSLRLLRYSKPKIPKKKSVSPGKFRLGGMRDAFVATYKVQRRFWATDSNRKQGLFAFYKPWRHHICIDECHYSYRDDLPENLDKTTAQECKTFTSSGPWAPFLNRKRYLIFKRSDKIHHCKQWPMWRETHRCATYDASKTELSLRRH